MEPVKRPVGRPRKQEVDTDALVIKRREYQNEYYKKNPRPWKGAEPPKKGRPLKYKEVFEEKEQDKLEYKRHYHRAYYHEHKQPTNKKIGRPKKDQALFDEVGEEMYNRLKYLEYYQKSKEKKEKMRFDLEKNNLSIGIDAEKND